MSKSKKDKAIQTIVEDMLKDVTNNCRTAEDNKKELADFKKDINKFARKNGFKEIK